MGTDEGRGGSAASELQFDKADFGDKQARLDCAACQQPIAGTYFQAGAATFCPRCRELVEAHQQVRPGLSGFLLAVVLGALAAAAGSLLYFGIAALTGYNFGLIAIVVGYLVGRAVRKGSGGRGGLVYQLLAVFLTYTSIVATYIPAIIEAVVKESEARPAVVASVPAGSTSRVGTTPGRMAPGEGTAPMAKGAPVAAPEAVPPLPGAAGEVAAEPAVPREARSTGQAIGDFLTGLVFLFGLSYALPFMALSEGGNAVMGLIIIGIGLMEAWRANQWFQVTFQGPFELGPASDAAPSSGV